MTKPKKTSLWKQAFKIRNQAYAPYSKFKVGAALVDNKGRVFSGCNVENSSYGATICAERGAIAAMIAAGGKTIREIAIVTDTPKGCPPCGICRQCLEEFAGDPRKVKVQIANLKGVILQTTLAQLLPHAFDQTYLD